MFVFGTVIHCESEITENSRACVCTLFTSREHDSVGNTASTSSCHASPFSRPSPWRPAPCHGLCARRLNTDSRCTAAPSGRKPPAACHGGDTGFPVGRRSVLRVGASGRRRIRSAASGDPHNKTPSKPGTTLGLGFCFLYTRRTARPRARLQKARV